MDDDAQALGWIDDIGKHFCFRDEVWTVYSETFLEPTCTDVAPARFLTAPLTGEVALMLVLAALASALRGARRRFRWISLAAAGAAAIAFLLSRDGFSPDILGDDGFSLLPQTVFGMVFGVLPISVAGLIAGVIGFIGFIRCGDRTGP